MKSSHVAIIFCVSATAAAALTVMYLRRPKVVIDLNDETGEGTVTMGKKSAGFNKVMGVVMGTWNGFHISVGSKDGYSSYIFRKNGTVLEQSSGITPYDGGSTYVEINHVKKPA